MDQISNLRRTQTKNESRQFFDFFLREVVTRIISISVSFFAALDSLYLVASVAIEALSSKSVFYEDRCREFLKFLTLTLLGSVFSVISPDVLCGLDDGRVSNSKLENHNFSHVEKKQEVLNDSFSVSKEMLEEKNRQKKDCKEISQTIQKLWAAAECPQRFIKQWDQSSLGDRFCFIQELDGDISQRAMNVRASLAASIYKANKTKKNQAVTWPDINSKPTYYHATSFDNIKKILQDGSVKVMENRLYKGAYVSTQPERAFGRVVLAFHRHIEYLSALEKGKPVPPRYWAGFSNDIPVNVRTLNSIFIFDATEDEIKDLQRFCDDLDWNKSKTIKVKKLPKNFDHLVINDLIPQDWNKSHLY